MSQFEVDPSQTFLAAICLPRTTSNEKVELKLGQITSEELETVKRFNDLHSRSIIFRHIHEEVVNYKLDQTWPNLMFIAHTILDKFEEFVLTLSHLETPIRQVQASFHEVLKNRRLQDELVVLGGAVNLSCWIPKVESAIIRLTPYQTSPYPFVVFADLERLMASAFSMRRKTLANNLKPFMSATDLIALGIDPGLRPEQISIPDYVQIAKFISN